MIDYFKVCFGIYIVDFLVVFNLLILVLMNKYLLSGIVEKFKGDLVVFFSFVDVYGILLVVRLFVFKGELEVNEKDFKLFS